MNITMVSATTTDNHETCFLFKNYIKIQKKLLHKHYTEAIQDLINIQNLHPMEPYAQKIHLNLIYAYYKTHDLKSANNSIQLFMKIYPNHKYLDYILYMHGIINMSLDNNNISLLAKYFNIHQNNYNPHYAIDAFHSLSKLIKYFPNSQYYVDSYKRLIILKNRIAEYELSIIKFYYQRHAYISVIIRSEKMLSCFQDTKATLHALHYMKKAYKNLNLIDQFNIVNKIITENSITY